MTGDTLTVATQPIAPPDPARLPARPTRILVADDEHLVATQITHTLASLGFTTVGPAADGMSAVNLARSGQPDLALLDIRMPKLDGLVAARMFFRSLYIPVVLITAYSDEDYIATAAEAGVFGYLVKPVSVDQVRAAIEIAWSRYVEHVGAASRADDLARRLEERKVVEQAKWFLVSTEHLSEPDAMRKLQKMARDSRRPLIQIATGIVQQMPVQRPL